VVLTRFVELGKLLLLLVGQLNVAHKSIFGVKLPHYF